MAKVMISVPDDLLARIDAEARSRGTTRSGLLQRAAAAELDRVDPERARRAAARIGAMRERLPAGTTLRELLADEKREREGRHSVAPGPQRSS
jgi:hypothetical protein